jgi:hypothetical protein
MRTCLKLNFECIVDLLIFGQPISGSYNLFSISELDIEH